MPLMQLSALMIHFWILPINLERPQEDKPPWNSTIWCNATDVHSGLFPEDVASLPQYIGWDMAQKNAVLRLFNSALNKNAQAVWDLMAHPPADLKGAVKIWTATWKKMWDRVWGFMAIENVLIKTDFHPHSIIDIPADFKPEHPILTSPVLVIMDQLLSVAWHRLTVKSKRMEKVLERLEKQAVEKFEKLQQLFEDAPSKLTVPMIKTTSQIIDDYSLRAQLFPSANRKKRIEEMKGFMGMLFAILDIKVHEHVITIDRTKFNTSMLNILKKLATVEQLKELEAYCVELFQLTAEGHLIEDI
ncbi:uncharacterized protein EI90DRAFT_3133562 [Cantharellus anzutake]|uniref:uncharacterized protein n=1 Tax=Cantharellus anzutake TaxID=1750568 RepID=UPI001906DF3D|nr:uncharacterized protein EI90DRAFT_3133562 [Cantharellus anzutake]KAF8318069.1 hypothetical protein EI90DRAFT_3133562 [Cantharellus anzutake]